MINRNGQILMPGLVAFLFLLTFFFILIQLGERKLASLRLEMAAQSTALSVARAEAEMMNKYASYNLEMNVLIPAKYRDYAATEVFLEDVIKAASLYQRFYQWPQFAFFSINVGRTVSRLNVPGANWLFYPLKPESQLELKDMDIMLLDGIVPVGVEEFDDVYFVREWDTSNRQAQPPHRTTWALGKDGLTASASAGLYLDANGDDPLQNGGFPVEDDEGLGAFGIQSFYPQFNAHLLPTIAIGKGLEIALRAGL